MDALNNQVTQILISALLAEAVALAGIGIRRGFAWLKAKAGVDKDQELSGSVDRVEKIAVTVVEALAQELVNNLRITNNGKVPENEAKAIKVEAVKRVNAKTPNDILKLLDKAGVDKEILINDAIEKAVLELKNGTNAKTATTTAGNSTGHT